MLLAEVVGFLAVGIGFLNWRSPTDHGVHWYDIVFGLFFLGFPIAMNLLHGDRPVDSGIRKDTLRRSATETAIATALMAGGLFGVGAMAGGIHWLPADDLAEMAGLYVIWGLVQQYLLQAFCLRRLQQAGLGDTVACFAAAVLFGLFHAPNWPLVALTSGAGVVWCRLFLRHPNLLPLGLAHALLAVLTYQLLPVEWTQKLAIGAMYVHRVSR